MMDDDDDDSGAFGDMISRRNRSTQRKLNPEPIFHHKYHVA
jgi:hypothetical protein